MTVNEEHLVDHMTTKLIAQAEADSHARLLLQEMIGELATEILATKAQISDLRVMQRNQGLAIDHHSQCLREHSEQLVELQRIRH